jgi:hypothetical protein
MMTHQSDLRWTPDLHLPAGSRTNLQEFISHEKGNLLQINVARQSAQVEINGRVVAETDEFSHAAALAELYMHESAMLLTKAPGGIGKEVKGQTYFDLRAEGGAYTVFASTDPSDLIKEDEQLSPLVTTRNLAAALAEVEAAAGGTLVPAFSDQSEIFNDLGSKGGAGLVVALWVSRWQLAFVPIMQEDAYSPLYFAVAKAPDGAYYAIYRLVDRSYLTEERSSHDAERVGTFVSPATARAYCHLFNAARHNEQWVAFPGSSATERRSEDGAYVLAPADDGFRLSTAEPEELDLGHFASVRLAQAYATVHKDALDHFALKDPGSRSPQAESTGS